MSFPSTPLGLRAEISAGGWQDISTDVYQRDGTSPPVVLTRGRQDESVQANPSSAAFELDNRSGNYSPDNPLGSYYGSIGQNTAVRFSVPAQVNYMRLETDSASYASAPDTAGVSITGDTEIQIDMWLSGWSACVLAAKWGGSGDDTWALLLNGDGTLSLVYYDGSVTYTSTSTLPLPVQHRIAVKATLQLNDGSGNHVVTFYTSTAIGGSWTILGTAVTVSGTVASLHDSGAAVTVGYSTGYIVTDANTGCTGMNGRVYEFRLISGIGGTTKADPVFSGRSAGDTTWSDAQSNTWTLHGTAEISDRDYRYHGQVSSLPPKWDVTGRDMRVPVTAAGLLNQLGQGSPPQQSAIYRYYTQSSAPAVAAYWPMEDGSGSAQLAAAAGTYPMYYSGSPQLASSTAFGCSQALPVTNHAAFTAKPDWGSVSWTDNDVRFLMQIPGAGEPNLTFVANIATTGTVALIQLEYTTASSGTLSLNGFDASGTSLFSGGVMSSVNGQALAIQIAVQQVLGDVDVSFAAMSPGGTAPFAPAATPVVSASVGAVTGVQFNQDGALASTVLGHLAILSAYTSIGALNSYACPDGSTTGPLAAWNGEPAGIRFGRLAAEQGYQFRGIGGMYATAAMGPQSAGALMALLQECEDADRGQVFEPRTCLGLGYRCRASMYNQAAALTLDYPSAQPGGVNGDGADTGLDPVYDDQFLRNSWEVSRSSGSAAGVTFRYTLDDGSAKSVGVIGYYADSRSVNVQLDTQVADTASWLVHLGTAPGARWPAIPVNLARSEMTSLYHAALDADIGDYIAVTSLPNAVLYDPVKQLAWQFTESLGGFHHTVEPTCVPESPYEVAVAGTAVAESSGTALHTSYSSGATSLSVDVPGTLWATGSGLSMAVMVAGEEMTVTAVSGSSTPQTFTATRSVNGVVKAQASGAAVTLYPPPVAAL